MLKLGTWILATIFLCGLCMAQSTQSSQRDQTAGTNQTAQTLASAPAQPSTPRMAPGSVIPVQLTKTVDAKKVKPGEEVSAKVTEDLKASSGLVLMPKDTEIVGHVTEAQARNKQERESEVGILFDHALMKTGEVAYPMSIQAVISPHVFQTPTAGNAGGEAAPSPSTSGQMQPPTGGGRNGMGGAGAASPPQTESQSENSSGAPAQSTPRPNITGNTKGVVGFSHLELSTATNPKDGSLITSEKNNVKLENGTLMLLRVNQ
jgi:hypothetical protein